MTAWCVSLKPCAPPSLNSCAKCRRWRNARPAGRLHSARTGQRGAGGITQRVLDEHVQPVFVERPMQLKLVGTYHDLLAFVSGVAGLPQIVTLHDFVIRPADSEGGALLSLTMLAKTYRYSDQGSIAMSRLKVVGSGLVLLKLDATVTRSCRH